MKFIISLIAFSALMIGVSAGYAAESDSADQPAYIYCKAKDLQHEEVTLACGFAKSMNQACNGGLPSRVNDKDVKEVIQNYRQCSNGEWIARIEVR